MTVVICNAGSNSANSGNVGKSTSPGLIICITDHFDLCQKMPMLIHHAFRRSRTAAREENGRILINVGNAETNPLRPTLRHHRIEVTPDHRRQRPTVTHRLIVALPHPSNVRAICAAGIPIKPTGWASSMQRPIRFTPIPGSMSTSQGLLK